MLPALLARSLFLALSLCASGAHADDAPYRRDVSVVYRILSPEIFEQTYTDSITIMAEAAIASMSQRSLSLNEHFSESVSLEAVNIKPDGRVVVVPAEQILLSSSPNTSALGVFNADVRVRTIVFPSVEVGDVLTYSHKTRSIAANVPGGMDQFLSIPPHARYGEVRLEVDAPSDMRLAVLREGFKEETSEAGGRRRYRWTLSPQAELPPEPASVSFNDYSPFVFFSNRQSDEEIGRWFYTTASAKAAVTPDVAKAARDLTSGIEGRREQARAIYDFVSTKVRYFNILIGQGGWIPHDASTILKNLYGDCKDHVTLMRAMLSAKGIEADYVLLNAGHPTYRAFDLPHTRYDHVVLYLPEFDLYADPTNPSVAFGVQPVTNAGKPVLHIGADRIERRTSPNLRAADEKVSVHTTIHVATDGRYSGKAIWLARANQAMTIRGQINSAEMRGRDEFMSNLLRRSSLRGKSSMEAGRSRDHSEPFRVEFGFDAENKLVTAPAERPPFPIGPHLMEAPHLTYLRSQNAAHRFNTTCVAQSFEVTLDVELPAGMEFGFVPLPVAIENEVGSYSASYQLEGRRLRMVRNWRLQPPQMHCSPALVRSQIMPLVTTMNRDVNMRLNVRSAQSK